MNCVAVASTKCAFKSASSNRPMLSIRGSSWREFSLLPAQQLLNFGFEASRKLTYRHLICGRTMPSTGTVQAEPVQRLPQPADGPTRLSDREPLFYLGFRPTSGIF